MASVVACFPLKSKALRDSILEDLLAAASVAKKKESGTLKYLVAVPHEMDAADPGSLYVVEEYQNSDAFALHCQQETVQRVAKSLQTAELGDGAMTLVLGADCELDFSRPEVSALSDPFVSILQLFFKSGAGPEGLGALRKVVEAGKSDSGTLGLSVYPDPKDNDAVRFLGVYESQDHYFKVHTESPEVKRFQAATKDITVETKAHFLKPVGGFLYKKQSEISRVEQGRGE